MSDDEKTKVTDASNDHIYFTVTPRLVWALCDDPDEYTFWCVVKDIAGEKGECILARDDLAALAMISAGRVSQCRDNLIQKKLLNGEFRRDPGYPQAVWHLSIPDFWEANTRWARRYPKIADRVEFKKEQKRQLKELKEASRADASRDASQDDRGVPPDDGGIPPDDTKKNVLKNQKEESIKDTCLETLQKFGYSVFGNNMTIWNNIKRRLEREDVTITGDDKKIVVSGLKEKPKGGLFTQAEIWQDRIAPSFAKLGLEVSFTE
jgi:hypothetical protein